MNEPAASGSVNEHETVYAEMPGATKVGAGIHVAPYALLHDETVVECADGGGAGQQISGIM